MRKFPLFIAFKKVLGVGMIEYPWRYWIISVFVLSFVMISIAGYLTGIEMGISHRPSVLFCVALK